MVDPSYLKNGFLFARRLGPLVTYDGERESMDPFPPTHKEPDTILKGPDSVRFHVAVAIKMKRSEGLCEPRVLGNMFPLYQGKPFWNSGCLSHSHVNLVGG